MKTKKLLTSALCLLAALLFSLALFPLSAVAEKIRNRRSVRNPGLVSYAGGHEFFRHSGKVTGYNYDYLEKISEYTGWEMEYVPYGSANGNEAVGNAISDLRDARWIFSVLC